jgi:hypothetical protein
MHITQILKRRIFFILVIGLFVRLAWVFSVPNVQMADSLSYKTSGSLLAASGDYYCWNNYRAYAAPGMPFLLSLIYSFAAAPDIYIKILMALISTAIIALLYLLCRFYFSEKIALGAALVYALYLNQLAYCSLFLGEIFFTFLLLAVIILLHKKPSPLILLLQAICLVWMVFIKLQALPLAIILILSIGRKKYFLHFGILLLTCFICVAAWTSRNHNLLGRWVFTTNGPVNLFIGNNINASGGWQLVLHSEMNETAQMDYYTEELKRNAIPPRRLMPLLIQKFIYLYISDAESVRYLVPEGIKDQSEKQQILRWQWLCLIEYIFIILGCFFSLVLMILQRIRIRLLFFLPLLYFTILQLVYFGDSRFHFPAMLYLIPVALTGWYHILSSSKLKIIALIRVAK